MSYSIVDAPFKMDSDGNDWLDPSNTEFVQEQIDRAIAKDNSLLDDLPLNFGNFNAGLFITPELKSQEGQDLGRKIIKIIRPERLPPAYVAIRALSQLVISIEDKVPESHRDFARPEVQNIRSVLHQLQRFRSAPEKVVLDQVETLGGAVANRTVKSEMQKSAKDSSQALKQEIDILRHLSETGLTTEIHQDGSKDIGSPREFRWVMMDKMTPMNRFLRSLGDATDISTKIKKEVASRLFTSLWIMARKLGKSLKNKEIYCFDAKSTNLVVEVVSGGAIDSKMSSIPNEWNVSQVLPIDFGRNGCYPLTEIVSGYDDKIVEIAVQLYQILAYYVNVLPHLPKKSLFDPLFKSSYQEAVKAIGKEYADIDANGKIRELVIALATHGGNEYTAGAMGHHIAYNEEIKVNPSKIRDFINELMSYYRPLP